MNKCHSKQTGLSLICCLNFVGELNVGNFAGIFLELFYAEKHNFTIIGY